MCSALATIACSQEQEEEQERQRDQIVAKEEERQQTQSAAGGHMQQSEKQLKEQNNKESKEQTEGLSTSPNNIHEFISSLAGFQEQLAGVELHSLLYFVGAQSSQ